MATRARTTKAAGAKRTASKRAASAKAPAGVRTAPKEHRFFPVEMALREHALALPEAHEDFPWGHRAFKVGKKAFLFLAWDNGVFSLSVKLPESAPIALMLPFAEPTGYGMGKSNWVTARFSGRVKPPVEVLRRWIDESFVAIAPKKLAARILPRAPAG